MSLKEEIVRTILSLARGEPVEMNPKPTIEEIEKMLNSEDPPRISMEPDGRILVARPTTTAGAVADKIVELIRSKLSIRLNDYLVEMKPDHDDSVTGFNEAWDVVRKALE